MRFKGEGPLTLKEFIQWLLGDDPRCASVRDVWMFEGAWLAGHGFHPDDFPMEQPLAAWDYGYGEWLKHVKEYR